MAISGLTPITALPNAAQLGGTPLGAGIGPVQTEKPGLFSRIGSALKAAVSALRGDVQPDAVLGAQSLAMQAGAPAAAMPTASAPVTVKTRVDKHGNVREKQTGKILKRADGTIPQGAEQLAAGAGLIPAGSSQLPSNATQLSGATVYSFDQNGNPVTMQQLGMTPTMLQGLTGVAGAADQATTPQVNATNQNSIGLGANGLMGTATPVLGQPILVTDDSASTTNAAAQPANQTVRNENSTDIASHNQGLDYGYGAMGLGNGLATPYSPYGASMTGAYTIGSPVNRWF